MATDRDIVFITGANTGLGFEVVKALCNSDRSYAILLGGRSVDKAHQAVKLAREQYPTTSSTIEAVQIDVEDDTSIETAFTTIETKFNKLDVLINNAGSQLDPYIAQGTITMREAWNQTWNVNVTGTQILTHTFIPLLLTSSNPRLIFITSGTATLTEHEKGLNPRFDGSPPPGWPKPNPGLPAYRSSKTGMNMMMREWVKNLHSDGVKVWGISPGFLATGLGGDQEKLKAMGALDPAIGGNFIKDVVEGKRDSDVGKTVRRDSVQPW